MVIATYLTKCAHVQYFTQLCVEDHMFSVTNIFLSVKYCCIKCNGGVSDASFESVVLVELGHYSLRVTIRDHVTC